MCITAGSVPHYENPRRKVSTRLGQSELLPSTAQGLIGWPLLASIQLSVGFSVAVVPLEFP